MSADVINENHMQPVAIRSQRDMLIRALGFFKIESDMHVMFFLTRVDAEDVCVVTLGEILKGIYLPLSFFCVCVLKKMATILTAFR